VEPGGPRLPRGLRRQGAGGRRHHGKEGDTFEAGRLGDYTVDADGSVLLGDPFVFNAENIGEFDF
jgi:hypothetical protein